MGGKILFLKHPFSISIYVGDVLKKDWKDSGTLHPKNPKSFRF
ncbi:hypothetical protein FLAVO9R_140196 [Flavobacterium sp. 9R]|nr:hypothetical protein FLAVO9R_140196 [Flavobacterium sp. 9R]